MRWAFLTLIAVTVCCGTALLRGDDSATTKPSTPTTKPSSGGGGGRLFSPYSKLTDLSDDQKEKIKEIHRKALDEIKEITAKENEDIGALLTDAQKQEVKELQEKTGGKAKAGEKSGNSQQ